MLRFFLSFLTLMLWSLHVSAAGSCADKRLDAPGMPLARMPIMNQGKRNLCYAVAAKQMIEFNLLSRGVPREEIPSLSILEIGANYKLNHENPDKLEWGIPHLAVNISIKEGRCRRPMTETDLSTEELEAFLDFVDKAKENKTPSCGSRNLQQLVEKASSYLQSKTLVKNLFQSCGERINLTSVPEAEGVFHPGFRLAERQSVLTGLIQKHLCSEHPQPVTIGFCLDLLKRKNIVSIPESQSDVTAKSCPQGLHAVLVIGQRISPSGRLQFLVRNSQGVFCDKAWVWECEKTTGQIWIDADKLTRNTTYTAVIGPL